MKVKCPGCGKESQWNGNPFRPFCSERCKIMDIGAWADEAYVIEGKPEEDEDENSAIENGEG